MKTTSKLMILVILGSTLFAIGQNKTKKEENIYEGLNKAQAEKVKTAVEDHTQDYMYIDKLIFAPKLKEFEKIRPTVEKRIESYQNRFNQANGEKTKKIWQEKLVEQQAILQKAKIWKLYRDYYILCRKSYKKDRDNYIKAAKAMRLLRKKYTEVTAERMPDPEGLFYSKYRDKLQQMKAREARARLGAR